MTKRIAILGFLLESNAFAPATTEADYKRRCLLAGDDIIAELAKPNPCLPSEVNAFCQQMEKLRPDSWELVPILVGDAEPGGPVEKQFFDRFVSEVETRLKAAGPLDGVYIVSHGAMRAEHETDPDGLLYGRVRDIVGSDVPLIATLDLHTNVSPKMAEQADVLISYLTNPHVDQRERAGEAACAMDEMWNGMRPKTAFVKVPIAAPSVVLLTAVGPYADIINAGQAAQQASGGKILNVSIAAGFIYSDSPKCGMSVIVTARDDQTAARALAGELAQRLWDDHERYQKTLTPISDAVAMAVACGKDKALPAKILADVADNPGGGGTGSTSYLLRALIEAQADGVVIGVVIDGAVAQTAHEAGEGADITARFNSSPRTAFEEAFDVQARVLKVTDGSFVGRRGILRGRALSVGPAALLEIGGLRVAVGTHRKQCADPAMLEMFGVDIAQVRTVVVKSRGHFRAGFDEFFAPENVIEVDCPGLTSPVFRNFEWGDLCRPVFPLDQDTTWTLPAW
ncbi:MAG: M81 family metallopeptidase [Rhodospirillales bacterium]